MTEDLFRIGFDMLFSELHKIMVIKVTFLGFRGGDRPNRPPPGSAPAVNLPFSPVALRRDLRTLRCKAGGFYPAHVSSVCLFCGSTKNCKLFLSTCWSQCTNTAYGCVWEARACWIDRASETTLGRSINQHDLL